VSSYFDLKPVPPSTRAELASRAGNGGLGWNATKFPWVHLQSMSSKGAYKILSSYTQGPITGTLYESNTRLKPVITSVKVKKQGELGTTRKFTVTILAFTDEQLGELQQSYFIPGMTVRVQFGWSRSADGQPAPAPYEDSTVSEPIAACQMLAKAQASAVYEGLQGLVSNFSYTLTPDNYWEGTIEVVSAAEPVLGTKLTNSCGPCSRIEINPEGDKVVVHKHVLHTFFSDIAVNFDNLDAYKARLEGPSSFFGFYAYEGEIRNPNGTAPSGWGQAWKVLVNKVAEEAEETFISFGALEKAIAVYGLPSADDVPTLGTLDSNNILIRTHADLESADPRVCLIGGTKRVKGIHKRIKGSALPLAMQKEGVLLSHIMVNTVFLATAFNTAGDDLRAFLQYVLDGINNACGNLWEFSVVSTTESGCGDGTKKLVPTVSITDSKIDTIPPPYLIPARPGNSVVRDLKLEMKMTDAMKTQALYSNRKGEAGKSCSKGDQCAGVTLKPFGLTDTVNVRNTSIPPITKAAGAPDCKEVKDPDIVAEEKLTLDKAFGKDGLGEMVTNETVQSAMNLLIEAYRGPQVEEEVTCKYVSLPLELGFTVDGVGGFRFGQTVSCDRLPTNIAEEFVYQITAVEHEVTPQDWTTSVTTIARWNPK